MSIVEDFDANVIENAEELYKNDKAPEVGDRIPCGWLVFQVDEITRETHHVRTKNRHWNLYVEHRVYGKHQLLITQVID